MTNDKGLIKASTSGVSVAYPTDVTLMILGEAALATYKTKYDWWLDVGEFGKFNPEKRRLDLEVSIRDPGFHLQNGLYEIIGDCGFQYLGAIDFGYHAQSDIWEVRALVAMNGECLEQLSKDPHASVRQKVVEYILYQYESNGSKEYVDFDFGYVHIKQEAVVFKQFTPKIVNIGDISYIDNMVADEDEGVRCTVARMGITRHIDALLDDPSRHVRMAIANKGQERHLEYLLDDDSSEVLISIICNQNATQQQLQTIAHREKCSSVLEALINRGIFHEFFIDSSEDDWLNSVAVRKGHCHERLSRHDSEAVRAAVASNTTDINILNRLYEDDDIEVSCQAASQISKIDPWANSASIF